MTRLGDLVADVHVEEPGRAAPWLARWFPRLMSPLVRLLFRPAFEAAEHLPSEGPYLLVANHSGGMALAEIACFAALWLERFGEERRLAALGHPFGFVLWPYKVVVRALGMVPSTHEAAQDALGKQIPVLVFPGGDYEAARPIWLANRVDFNRRRGFLKIAQRAGVPIVPLGIRGSHITVPILWRSDWLLARLLIVPRLLGLKRFPVTLVGVVGSAAIGVGLWPVLGPWSLLLIWIFLLSPVSVLPIIPSTIRMRFGPPISAEALFSEEDLDQAYDRVVGEIQALVTPPK